MVQDMPGILSREVLVSIMDILGRVIRISTKIEQDRHGPLDQPAENAYPTVLAHKEQLGVKDPRALVSLLEAEVAYGDRDPMVLLALALLIQRALLDLPVL